MRFLLKIGSSVVVVRCPRYLSCMYKHIYALSTWISLPHPQKPSKMAIWIHKPSSHVDPNQEATIQRCQGHLLFLSPPGPYIFFFPDPPHPLTPTPSFLGIPDMKGQDIWSLSSICTDGLRHFQGMSQGNRWQFRSQDVHTFLGRNRMAGDAGGCLGPQ